MSILETIIYTTSIVIAVILLILYTINKIWDLHTHILINRKKNKFSEKYKKFLIERLKKKEAKKQEKEDKE